MRNPHPPVVPAEANISWSLDFMHDSLTNEHTILTLNIIDQFNREGLWIEVDTSILAACVVRVLDMLALWRGYPKQLHLDNTPEFNSQTLPGWEPNRILLQPSFNLGNGLRMLSLSASTAHIVKLFSMPSYFRLSQRSRRSQKIGWKSTMPSGHIRHWVICHPSGTP